MDNSIVPKQADSPVILKTRNGQHIRISFEGSLGLLALGDVGLLLWRDAKEKLQTLST